MWPHGVNRKQSSYSGDTHGALTLDSFQRQASLCLLIDTVMLKKYQYNKPLDFPSKVVCLNKPFFIIIPHICVLPAIYAHTQACPVPKHARRHQIPGNWSYRQL